MRSVRPIVEEVSLVICSLQGSLIAPTVIADCFDVCTAAPRHRLLIIWRNTPRMRSSTDRQRRALSSQQRSVTVLCCVSMAERVVTFAKEDFLIHLSIATQSKSQRNMFGSRRRAGLNSSGSLKGIKEVPETTPSGLVSEPVSQKSEPSVVDNVLYSLPSNENLPPHAGRSTNDGLSASAIAEP